MLAAGARDLAREVGIPPDVIDVDRDADAFAQLVAEVVGLRERVHAGAVGGEHRMQRLDRERHACLPRIGQQRGEPSRTCRARVGDVARALRQPADHEDEALRADGGGFVDGAAVVVERRAAPGVVGGGKHAAAAKAGDGHPVRADELAPRARAAGLHDVAPRRDRGDAGAGAALDELLRATTASPSSS